MHITSLLFHMGFNVPTSYSSMEMDSFCLNSNMEGIGHDKVEQSLSPSSSEMGYIFGDPEVPPRIGNEYQAEIPPLLSERDRLQLINSPRNTEFMADVHKFCRLGLPIPVTWSNDGIENINGIIEFESSEESQATSNIENPEFKVEPTAARSDYEKDAGFRSSFQLETGRNKVGVDIVSAQEPESKMDLVEKTLCPLPDSPGESWTDIERDSFLLGLYIFGKNFVAVKKFVEGKKMGHMLYFYYGRFYRSDEHRRWSGCQKQRSRRSIHGEKIFTGWRQQELLSRLSTHVSQECQSLVLEACRTYAEGRISFEGYVFRLKNIVGINILIQAVGIGKGKDDLTGTAMEPIKHNQTISLRPEIPIGKGWSSVNSADIIKFLTGDFRLSKARSNDLFWEAVWPRLLASGWHSEQPKDNGISCLKNSLVFLIPGVKKFSRRRLVKGNHYFDSVSDVLSKVASEPGLLELDVDAAKSSQNKEESEWYPPLKQDQDGMSTKEHHCYLQPRNRNLPQFTIVDTSLPRGEGAKVKELRSLPVDAASLSIFSSVSGETDEDSSEDSQENEFEVNNSNQEEDVTEGTPWVNSSDCANGPLNMGRHSTPDTIISAEESHQYKDTSLNYDKQLQKTMKYQFSRKAKPGCSRYLVPVTKLHRINACHAGDSSCSTRNTSADRKVPDESHYMSNSPDACEEVIFPACTPHNLSSASSLAKYSQGEGNEGVSNVNASPEKHPYPKLIDLNIPFVSPDFAVDEHSSMTAMEQINDYSSVNNSSFLSGQGQQPEAFKLPDAEVHPGQQQSTMNSRRQSVRNRPLTTKALEALEMGFLSLTKKRKGADISENNSTSRPSPRVRRKTGSKATSKDDATNDAAESRTGESLDGFQDNSDMIDEP